VNVHGFPETDGMMTILLDDDEHEHPTFMNIIDAFKSLSEQSQPGDTVLIQFSGHGGRILDAPIDSEVESYDEMIAPSDYATKGLIRDTLIFKTLLAPMRYGVTVTILIDCCDTGMMLDLPYSWSTLADRPDLVPKMAQSEDFSFVRFLKVVKTLYEASTFTQLGRTVGTALGKQPPPLQPEFFPDHEPTADRDFVPSREDVDRTQRAADMQLSSEPLFVSLCSPRREKQVAKKNGDKDALSMLEQMLGCNFMANEAEEGLSDEETYANNTFDEHTIQNSTFDSASEDEFRRSKGRSIKNRRN
jgi:Caspase domain